MRRKKIIMIPKRRDLKQLAQDYTVSETSVYNALSYKTESELAQMIREKAVNHYGGVVTTKLVF